ncbi:unnamed protein product [Didymodactylos carnosus]|uniref:Uncharacterized protein n=1 Tax=Didymodactylos carnosus TaxID=1234261 RepID=A0A8S2CVB1_9BILA|nr:unnamed protein product [Didymodactylos carnosus]CAF3513639.1 unnamed protein product [Didymodactylos carnosus]
MAQSSSFQNLITSFDDYKYCLSIINFQNLKSVRSTLLENNNSYLSYILSNENYLICEKFTFLQSLTLCSVSTIFIYDLFERLPQLKQTLRNIIMKNLDKKKNDLFKHMLHCGLISNLLRDTLYSCQNLTTLESLESLTLIYTWCYHKLLNLFQYIPNLKYLRLLFVLSIEKNYKDKHQRQHIYDKLNNKQYHHRLLLLKYLQVNYDVFYDYDSIYGHYFLSHFPCIKLIKITTKDRYYRRPRDGVSQTISRTKTIITNYYNNQNQDLWIDEKIINIEEKPYSSVSFKFSENDT